MLGRDVILPAVKKLTRETISIVRVSVLPRYKRERREVIQMNPVFKCLVIRWLL